MNENNYRSMNPNNIKGPYGPYLLVTKKYEPGSMAGGPGGWKFSDIYEFKTKKELEEAMKTIEGIPVKTLEAKITKIHKIEVKE